MMFIWIWYNIFELNKSVIFINLEGIVNKVINWFDGYLRKSLTTINIMIKYKSTTTLMVCR